MPETTIVRPAGWITETAIAFGDTQGAQLVDAAHPLPVILVAGAQSSPLPLTGTATASQVAGPFAATNGKALTMALAGSWSGRVQLLRSTDGGTTRLPLTPASVPVGIMTTSGVDQPWVETEDGATYYLAITLSSGTLTYRVSQ